MKSKEKENRAIAVPAVELLIISIHKKGSKDYDTSFFQNLVASYSGNLKKNNYPSSLMINDPVMTKQEEFFGCEQNS